MRLRLSRSCVSRFHAPYFADCVPRTYELVGPQHSVLGSFWSCMFTTLDTAYRWLNKRLTLWTWVYVIQEQHILNSYNLDYCYSLIIQILWHWQGCQSLAISHDLSFNLSSNHVSLQGNYSYLYLLTITAVLSGYCTSLKQLPLLSVRIDLVLHFPPFSNYGGPMLNY